jgi:hypothetical protein
MPEHNPGQLGGTMRLGKRTTVFKSEENTICKYDLYCNIIFFAPQLPDSFLQRC